MGYKLLIDQSPFDLQWVVLDEGNRVVYIDYLELHQNPIIQNHKPQENQKQTPGDLYICRIVNFTNETKRQAFIALPNKQKGFCDLAKSHHLKEGDYSVFEFFKTTDGNKYNKFKWRKKNLSLFEHLDHIQGPSRKLEINTPDHFLKKNLLKIQNLFGEHNVQLITNCSSELVDNLLSQFPKFIKNTLPLFNQKKNYFHGLLSRKKYAPNGSFVLFRNVFGINVFDVNSGKNFKNEQGESNIAVLDCIKEIIIIWGITGMVVVDFIGNKKYKFNLAKKVKEYFDSCSIQVTVLGFSKMGLFEMLIHKNDNSLSGFLNDPSGDSVYSNLNIPYLLGYLHRKRTLMPRTDIYLGRQIFKLLEPYIVKLEFIKLKESIHDWGIH